MNEATSKAIEERVVRLEREIKRGKRATTAGMALLALVIVWGAAARSGRAGAADSGSGDLLARSLTIVDAKRNLGIALLVTDEGPRVALIEKGRPRISLGIYKDGPRVTLNDTKGNQCVSLGVGKDGPRVLLYDQQGIGRITLVVDKDGPDVRLVDERGHKRVSLVVNKNGGGVGLHDEMENPRLTMSVDKNGGGVIFIDETDRPRLAMTAGKAGSSVLLLDDKGNPGVDLETTEHSSSVVLADEKGTRRAVLGSLPLGGGRTRSTEPISSRTLLDKEDVLPELPHRQSDR